MKISNTNRTKNIDLIGMCTAGAVLGFGIDTLADTRPWVTIFLIFFGFFGAVWRTVRK